ncbi:unnamed protein product [Ectocarpus sp. 12 AP-2014]
MACSPARRGRRAQHHHHCSSSATGRRTRRLTVVLLALFSVHTTTATAHAPSASFSPSGSSIFQGVGDDSPLARTMKGAAGSARISGRAGGGDPYTVAAPGAEPLKLSHGTTTVALVCDGGVIAAVDSRASMGSFVGSRTTQKARLGEVSQHILGTMAGGAADCTFWLRYLGMQAKVFEDRNGFQMPVATAARVLADALMGQRGKGLSVGTMIMGHDRGNRDSSGKSSVRGGNQGGGQLYYVDSDGARVKGRYFSVGSGSTYAYSVLDEGYRDGMSLEEAADLAKRAVRHATYRDAFSGGFINVFVVDASGWTRLDVDDSGFFDLTQPSDATPDPIGREER